MTIKFADEEKRVAEVRTIHRKQFELAERILDSWMQAEKERFFNASTLSGSVKRLAKFLNVQACRLFRSVIEECARCEATGASLPSRSLFETALALVFILKPSVQIICFDKKNNGKWAAKAPSQKCLGTLKDSLTQEKRVHLYIAHSVFESERFAKRCETTPSLHAFLSDATKRVSPQDIATVQNAVGEQWSFILRDKRHYSGMSIRELAELLDSDLLNWYDTVYHYQSRVVHAANVFSCMQVDVDNEEIRPKYLSCNGEVLGVLQGGIQMFLVCIKTLHGHIDFGAEVETLLDGSWTEFTQLF